MVPGHFSTGAARKQRLLSEDGPGEESLFNHNFFKQYQKYYLKKVKVWTKNELKKTSYPDQRLDCFANRASRVKKDKRKELCEIHKGTLADEIVDRVHSNV